MSIVINELLPNPIGRDTGGEFIELLNQGEITKKLSGLVLKDKGGKQFALSGELKANSYLVLPYAQTKLNLNNDGDAVSLYNSAGQLISNAEYILTPKEGASYARQNDGTFAFTDTVTKGVANIFKEVYVAKENFRFESAGAVLTNSVSGFEAVALILLASLAFTVLSVYFLRDAIHPQEYIL